MSGPNGRTNVAEGVLKGLDEFLGVEGKKLLVLLTDGEDEKIAERLTLIQNSAARYKPEDLEAEIHLFEVIPGGTAADMVPLANAFNDERLLGRHPPKHQVHPGRTAGKRFAHGEEKVIRIPWKTPAVP